MRLGMFATATFRGQKSVTNTAVPATSILHLHDTDWVFVIAPDKKFRRVEVKAGAMLAEGMQEILSGIAPGTQVVKSALTFQNTVDQ